MPGLTYQEELHRFLKLSFFNKRGTEATQLIPDILSPQRKTGHATLLTKDHIHARVGYLFSVVAEWPLFASISQM